MGEGYLGGDLNVNLSVGRLPIGRSVGRPDNSIRTGRRSPWSTTPTEISANSGTELAENECQQAILLAAFQSR